VRLHVILAAIGGRDAANLCGEWSQRHVVAPTLPVLGGRELDHTQQPCHRRLGGAPGC
jgi:hypothetical protein